MRATYPAHLVHLQLITLLSCGRVQIMKPPVMKSPPPVTPFLLRLDIILNTVFSNILSYALP
jgi:hypothetical protein